jgi:hypothetical protein
MVLSKEEVIVFLKKARPDMTIDDWKYADIVTVLQWAIPTWNTWKEKESE